MGAHTHTHAHTQTQHCVAVLTCCSYTHKHTHTYHTQTPQNHTYTHIHTHVVESSRICLHVSSTNNRTLYFPLLANAPVAENPKSFFFKPRSSFGSDLVT